MNDLIEALMRIGNLEFHSQDYGHELAVENPLTKRGIFVIYNDRRAHLVDLPSIVDYLNLPMAPGERNSREAIYRFLKPDGL